MQRVLALLAFLLLVGSCDILASNEGDMKAQASAMLSKALEVTNIQARGSPSFRLHARVWTLDEKDKPLEGTYLLLWKSPEESREEMSFPGYSEISVHLPGKIWRKRNLDYIPILDSQTRNALELHWLQPLGPHEAVRRIDQRNENGSDVTCMEIAWEKIRSRVICVEAATGAPTHIEELSAGFRVEFSDYLEFGGHRHPQNIRSYHQKKLMVEVHVDELSPLPPTDSSAFQPPEGSKAWPACAYMTSPIMQHMPALYNTSGERFFDATGIPVGLTYYVHVDAEGNTREFHLLHWEGLGRAVQALQDQASRMKYAPATCNGAPVEMELVTGFYVKVRTR